MIRISRLFALTALVVSAFLASQVQGQQAPKQAETARNIDVVLCLDVSGSMQGLISSAKSKLWDIVNELAKIKPSPNLRVGLYSYGHSTYDAQKGWVRKELDLTTDLDALYQKLFALTINGGTELVTRVSRDAIIEQPWSEGKESLRLIFVAGNEPASQDKLVSLKEAAELAKKKDIIINPIFCGQADAKDAQDWKELAQLAGGRFASINQNQQVVVNTPQDKKLAELADKLNNTYVAYGKEKEKAENQRLQTANSAKQGAGVLAGRVAAQNTAFYNCKDWDLVDRCKTDPKFDISKIPDADLSEEMKKMTLEQRVAHVKEMTAKREVLQKEITELSKQRDAYIREEQKRNPNPALRAFDQAIRETLRAQAGARGIQIPEE